MNDRNCGNEASGIGLSVNASRKKPVLCEKPAALSYTLTYKAIFPQLRPGYVQITMFFQCGRRCTGVEGGVTAEFAVKAVSDLWRAAERRMEPAHHLPLTTTS